MSDPTSTLLPVFHPWRALRALPEVTQRWVAFEDDRLGTWCKRRREIELDDSMNQAERRCTLTHELIHRERGDDGHPECHPAVHKEAARRLISIEALVDAALFHGDDTSQLAEALWVDEVTLITRLQHLHPAERGYLRRRLAKREASA